MPGRTRTRTGWGGGGRAGRSAKPTGATAKCLTLTKEILASMSKLDSLPAAGGGPAVAAGGGQGHGHAEQQQEACDSGGLQVGGRATDL